MKRRHMPSPALVIALAALFISLGGTAIAAGVVPLAKRALVADNAMKLGGQTPASIAASAARRPGPASSAAGLVTVKTAPWSLAPGGFSDTAAMCDSGQKAAGGATTTPAAMRSRGTRGRQVTEAAGGCTSTSRTRRRDSRAGSSTRSACAEVRGRLHRSIGVAAAAVLLAGEAAGARAGQRPRPALPRGCRRVHSRPRRERRAAGAPRPIRRRQASVRIEISDAYSPEAVSGQTWAQFFVSLVHGSELATATIRIAPPAEVAATCGQDALGCYSGGLMLIPGEQSGGIAPEEIARHEYGHHVAASRLNPPWTGSSYGPKHWSTAEGICARAKEGGLPGRLLALHPFAERGLRQAYRVLNDRRTGIAGLTWGLVDELRPERRRAPRGRAGRPLTWLAPTTTVRQRPIRGEEQAPLGIRVHDAAGRDGHGPAPAPAGRTDALELLDAQGQVVARAVGEYGTAPLVRRLRSAAALDRVTLAGTPGVRGLDQPAVATPPGRPEAARSPLGLGRPAPARRRRSPVPSAW